MKTTGQLWDLVPACQNELGEFLVPYFLPCSIGFSNPSLGEVPPSHFQCLVLYQIARLYVRHWGGVRDEGEKKGDQDGSDEDQR